jgi:hypothetical protein
MFLDKIFTKVKFKRVIIFVVRIEGKTGISFQRYNVTFKEKSAVLESKSEKISETAEKLFEDIDIETPVYVYILGRGIVNRLFTEEKIEDHMVEDLYPNFNSELNYFIRSDISSSQTSVAFVRKTQIEEILLEKYFKEIQVLGFIFGLAPIITLLDYFDYEKSDVMLEGFWFKKLGDEYSAFKSEEEEDDIVFFNQQYKKDEILALSAAIY